MTYSQLRITFGQDLARGYSLQFKVTNPIETIKFRWEHVRTGSNQVEIGVPEPVTPGQRSAINFMLAFQNDYPSRFELSRNLNEVTIKSKVQGMDFYEWSSTDPLVEFDGTNYLDDFFNIETVILSESTSKPKCSYYKATMTTSEAAYTVFLNGVMVIDGNTANPFTFEALRGQNLTIKAQSISGQPDSYVVPVPMVLNEGLFNFQSMYSPNGGTITISPKVDVSSLNLEYSLDGDAWQTSNVFSSILVGTYTIHVRDNYGCSFTKSITIDKSGSERTPYFLISKSNSIQFAERVVWSTCDVYKTDENTLSCEADVELPYTEIQQFQTCDIVTTQIKSNYSDITATVVTSDAEIPLLVEKKSTNMGLKDRRDARKYNLGSGLTGVYFISGNFYDYDTGVATGETYTLNGALPIWAARNSYIRVDNVWLKIKDVFFDDTKNADVAVLESIYTGLDVETQVSSIYNMFNYEVYEFSILMVDYLNQNFQVRINNNDSDFSDLTHLSEVINVKVNQPNTVAIRYSNSHNTDIFYASGIQNIIRLPINKINGKLFDESEAYITDTSAILLNVELHELNEFEFEPITKQMMWKLTQALSHDTVKIDGVGYVKNASTIEVEGPLERTNLYVIKATMIKTNSTFNERSGGSYNTAQDALQVDIPALIDYGQGYVIYR